MGACRETASLWHWIFREGKWGKRRPINRLFRNEYFWADTFGRYIYRYLICKLLGHRNAMWVDDDNNRDLHICFSCMTKLGYRESTRTFVDYPNIKMPPPTGSKFS